MNLDMKDYEKRTYLEKLEYWLFRLYENKYEADKLYIDFHKKELRELICQIKQEANDEKGTG